MQLNLFYFFAFIGFGGIGIFFQGCLDIPTTATLKISANATPSVSPDLTSSLPPVNLKWQASSSFSASSGPVNYMIYRNGKLLGATTSLTYTDETTSVGNSYTYSVVASDAQGNTSAPSNQATLTR